MIRVSRPGVIDSWYPSCVVKLTIRFDESLQVGRPKDEISVDALASQTQESRITGKGTSAARGGDRTTPTGVHRQRRMLDQTAPASLTGEDDRAPGSTLTPGTGQVTQKGGTAPTQDTEPLTYGTDAFTVIANRVPKKGTFTLPHPRSAPTFSLVFDYKEFPIDPNIVRAIGVEIHLGSVPAEDFARGMRGETDRDGRPLSILKTTTDVVDPFTGRKMINDATLLFYGTVDTMDVDHTETGSTVTFEGREIRAILIDTKIVPKDVLKVNLKNNIVDVVGDLIQTIPFENGFRLVVATLEQEWPNATIPSPGDAEGMTAVRVKAATRTGAKTKPKSASGSDSGVQTGDKATQSTPDNGAGASYWDLITNYCELVGAMPHIIGSMLWIRPVHRVFDVVDPNSKIPTPFAGGNARVVGDERLRARRLVLGKEIKRIKLQRKFGGVSTVPTVQTISFDDTKAGTQRLIFGQWPASGSQSGDVKADAELLRVPMWGVRSVERLTQIARGIYEEMGRGETGGTCDTNVLASFGGDNDDPDILRCRPLEPVEFVVSASDLSGRMPISSDINDLASMSFAEEVEALHGIIGDRALARAFVALSRGAVREVLRYYQVVGVTFDWDKGVKTTIAFQNYVVPRHNESAVSDVPKSVPNKVVTRTVKVPGAEKKSKVSVTPRAIPAAAETNEGLKALNAFFPIMVPHSEPPGPRVTIGKATGDRPTRPRKL